MICREGTVKTGATNDTLVQNQNVTMLIGNMAEEVEKFVEKVEESVFFNGIGHSNYKNLLKKVQPWNETTADVNMSSKHVFKYSFCVLFIKIFKYE